jgi:hypothetical protein
MFILLFTSFHNLYLFLGVFTTPKHMVIIFVSFAWVFWLLGISVVEL